MSSIMRCRNGGSHEAMSPWLCSSRDARRIASCHNLSRFTTPVNLTAGTKLDSYRASGLVRRPRPDGQGAPKRSLKIIEAAIHPLPSFMFEKCAAVHVTLACVSALPLRCPIEPAHTMMAGMRRAFAHREVGIQAHGQLRSCSG